MQPPRHRWTAIGGVQALRNILAMLNG